MNRLTGVRSVTKSYYWATFLAILACWSPFKVLPYAVPFILVALLVLIGEDTKVMIRLMAWIAIWIAMILFYGLINSGFQWHNALVAFVTWAGIAVVLMIPSEKIADFWLQDRLTKLAWVLLGLEALWGIVQSIYGFMQTRSFDLANGDFVEGTIHPWLEPELAYSNVMFAINIALLLLYLFPSVQRTSSLLKRIVYFLGIFAFVLASVVHAILFLMMASGIAIVLVIGRRMKIKRLISIIGIISTAIIISAILLPQNLRLIGPFVLQIIYGEAPKSASFSVAVWEMPKDYWYLPVFGLGPGQYASRAGLMSTGLYFGGLKNPRSLPLLPNQLTEGQEKYLMPLWEWHESVQYFGSTQKPYFSWLAVYTEWGLLGWFVVLAALISIVQAIKRISPVRTLEKLAVMTAVWFIWLLGFQENNWEVPQAWFSGILLIKVMYASAKYGQWGRKQE